MTKIIYFVRQSIVHSQAETIWFEKRVDFVIPPTIGDKLVFNEFTDRQFSANVDHRTFPVDKQFVYVVLKPHSAHYNQSVEALSKYLKRTRHSWHRIKSEEAEPKDETGSAGQGESAQAAE